MSELETTLQRVAIIGFGEAGAILGADLAKQGLSVSTYDVLIEAPQSRAALLQRAAACGVRAETQLSAAVAYAQLVICAVTASSAGAAAEAAAAHLRPPQIFMDINSVSPGSKREHALTIEAAGAHYVDAAVMAPLPPQRLRVPILLGGASAVTLAAQLAPFGLQIEVVSEQVGVASAIKMCRSILIKGLESLTLECLFAARRLGAEQQVLASLEQSFPSMGWNAKLPDYLISRIAEHGRRRAAELREVAATQRSVGLEPHMARATAMLQDGLVDQMQAAGLSYRRDQEFSWRALADALG